MPMMYRQIGVRFMSPINCVRFGGGIKWLFKSILIFKHGPTPLSSIDSKSAAQSCSGEGDSSERNSKVVRTLASSIEQCGLRFLAKSRGLTALARSVGG